MFLYKQKNEKINLWFLQPYISNKQQREVMWSWFRAWTHLHCSPVHSHGHSFSSNCVVDSCSSLRSLTLAWASWDTPAHWTTGAVSACPGIKEEKKHIWVLWKTIKEAVCDLYTAVVSMGFSKHIFLCCFFGKNNSEGRKNVNWCFN